MHSPGQVTCATRCLFSIALCWFGATFYLLPTLRSDENARSELRTWRRYTDGPLAAADFRGQPPAFRPVPKDEDFISLIAYTTTELRYDSRFQTTRLRDRWIARLVSVEAFAIVLSDKSWNKRPGDERLLDHEQGHFDLTHAFALAMQLHLDERLKSRKRPQGVGDTSDAATRDLENKLRGELQPFFDDHVKAQRDYDRLTRHGDLKDAQSAQRKLQRDRVNELNDKLDTLKKEKSR